MQRLAQACPQRGLIGTAWFQQGCCCQTQGHVCGALTPRNPRNRRKATDEDRQRSKSIVNPFLGELIGTALLILLGDAVVANVVLRGTKGNGAGWIVITWGWWDRRLRCRLQRCRLQRCRVQRRPPEPRRLGRPRRRQQVRLVQGPALRAGPVPGGLPRLLPGVADLLAALRHHP
jgi:hypothetical protein